MTQKKHRIFRLIQDAAIGFVSKVWGLKQIFVTAGMVAHPVTQVIGEQALVDILDLSVVDW